MSGNVRKTEKALLVGFWLFWCFLLWSPWAGSFSDGPRIGPEIRKFDYGIAGYYSVTIIEGLRTEHFEVGPLVFTLVFTVLLSVFCIRLWQRGSLW